MQLLMELHGTRLERMLEIIFAVKRRRHAQSIDELGRIRWSAACWCSMGFIPRSSRLGWSESWRRSSSRLYKMGAEADAARR